MQVVFASRKLQKCFLESSKGIREWGEAISRKYIQRINILQNAKSMADLNSFPGLRFHSLKGNWTGQYAMNLDGAWRLIFTVEGDVLKIICILEVSRHYDD